MKKSIQKSIILLLVLSLTFLFACGKDGGQKQSEGKTKLDQIKEKGELVMGTSADYPPMEWIQVTGKDQNIVGVDIEIAKAIADKLGVKLVIKNMDFTGLLNSLNADDIDIVLAGMVASPERMKEVDFSEAYYSGGQVLLVRKGEEGTFKSIEDLKGKKIGTQMASIQQQYAEANFDATVTGLENNNNLLMELKNNTFDCLFMAELAAKQFAYANDDVALIEDLDVPDEEGNAVAVKKGNPELLEVINEVISDLQKDDKVTSWFNQYVEISTKEINENK